MATKSKIARSKQQLLKRLNHKENQTRKKGFERQLSRISHLRRKDVGHDCFG